MIQTKPFLSSFNPFVYFQYQHDYEIPNCVHVDQNAPGILEAISKKSQLLKEYFNWPYKQTPVYGALEFESWDSDQDDHCQLREIETGFWALIGSYNHQVQYLFSDSVREKALAQIKEWSEAYKKVKTADENLAKIHLLCQGRMSGFNLRSIPIQPDFECDVELNYGSDFMPEYEKLVQSLQSEKSGLYCFAGAAGAGKTSLIKQIIKTIPNQKAMFLPPQMSNVLLDPSFVPFLIESNVNLVIIEDAENCMRSRDETGDNGVSNLLNLTSGITADFLNLRILTTFNTNTESIDKALLRKGRLKWMHTFGPLKAADSDKLLIKLGFEPQNKAMTLADIYNFAEENGYKPKEARSMNIFANKG